MVVFRIYCRGVIALSISELGKLFVQPSETRDGLGRRHENDPGGQQDLDKVPRALTHIAYVAARSLHQPFPLVGCVMDHLLLLVVVSTLWESLAVTLLRPFGHA